MSFIKVYGTKINMIYFLTLIQSVFVCSIYKFTGIDYWFLFDCSEKNLVSSWIHKY